MPDLSEFSGSSGTRAGAAMVDLTPAGSIFLFGYPHVERRSLGVNDPLECAALYLASGPSQALFVANDLIFFSREFAGEVRRRITAATGVPFDAIMLTATHTHSGPVMVDCLSNAADSVVPRADPALLAWLADRMVEAAISAVKSAVPAEVGLGIAAALGVGGNRHDPSGPSDPEVPVLLARSLATGRPIGCMIVYAMHPTVLHEDSRWISADFPGYTREYLRASVLPSSCPVIYHLGAAGNQSPRHVARENTFSEARRLGTRLGECVADALKGITSFTSIDGIETRSASIALAPRAFPSAAVAAEHLGRARARHARAVADGLRRQEVRTAECDVFGAEKTLLFAQAAADGRLEAAIETASPAEIQAIRIGGWCFVGWPGEFFVEYGLALRQAARAGTFLITLANGELQGYIATPEASAAGCYEGTNAVFDATNGLRFVARTVELLEDLGWGRARS